MKKSPYLTAEETAALIADPVVVDWERKARALMREIEAAWAEMPEDLLAIDCELAGAVCALRIRAENAS